MEQKSFQIKPLKIGIILISIAAFFSIFSTILWYFPTRFQWNIGPWFELFFVDREKNFPTAFSVLLLFTCFLLLVLIGAIKKGLKNSYLPHWITLAIGFLLMACDEFIMLHEKLIKPMNLLLGNKRSDLFYFGWVLPGAILVVILAIIFIKFLIHLPPRTRWLFIIGAVLYLTGAIVLEMLGGYIVKTFGPMTKQYVIAATIEESCEMSGTIVFIYALLDYISRQVNTIVLSFSAKGKVSDQLEAQKPQE